MEKRPERALEHSGSLLSLEGLSSSDLLEFLKSIESMEKGPAPKGPVLPIALVFVEPSTRTRFSFEVAAVQLGLYPAVLSPEGSSLKKGESLLDTLLTLQAVGIRAAVVRHPTSGILSTLAPQLQMPLINAGDGWRSHPTQALLDLYTLWKARRDLKGLRLLFLGDLLHSRVFRSLCEVLLKMEAEISVCAPPGLLPPGLPVQIHRLDRLDPLVLRAQDAVYVLRMQFERHGELAPISLRDYQLAFQLRAKHLEGAQVRILHPGPVNRGVEIEGCLMEDSRSLILEQVHSGVWTRMAVLYRAIHGGLWKGPA